MGHSFPAAATIEASLALAADRGGDLTGQVYDRLFAARPELEALFGNDASNAVKGEMLAQVFDTIFDFIGDRVYADHLLRSHGQVHEAYGVSSALFLSFFTTVAETVAEVLGSDWPGETAQAWSMLLAEIEATLAPA